MHIAHIADIHYSPKHLKWVDRAMAAAVERAIEEKCDAAVLAGDSFDHGMSLHEPAVAAYVRQVVRLADHMPVLVLQGTYSHDRPGSLDVLKELPTSYQVFVADEPGTIMLHSTGAFSNDDMLTDIQCCFCVLPSLNKAHPAIMEHGARKWVDLQMAGFHAETIEARKNGIPTVLVSHGTVNGCLTESRFAMVAPDHEFKPEQLFSAGADAVMLGHIHKFQVWHDDNQIIAYPGSLARLVHGDHDPKGWLLWVIEPEGDIKPGSVMYQFIESPTRQLFEVEFDGPPVMGELEGLAAQAGEDDAVRIRWAVDAEHAHTIDKSAIRDLFAHSDSVRLEGTVLAVSSVRAEGISRAVSLEEKLGYWLETTGDQAAKLALSERLAMLQAMEPEQIADAIINPEPLKAMEAA